MGATLTFFRGEGTVFWSIYICFKEGNVMFFVGCFSYDACSAKRFTDKYGRVIFIHCRTGGSKCFSQMLIDHSRRTVQNECQKLKAIVTLIHTSQH